MGNYAVRIYEADLRQFVSEEAAKTPGRGAESRVVAAALRAAMAARDGSVETVTDGAAPAPAEAEAEPMDVARPRLHPSVVASVLGGTSHDASQRVEAVRAAYRAVLEDEMPAAAAEAIIAAAEARVGKTGSLAHVRNAPRGRSYRARVAQAAAASRRRTGSDADVDDVAAAPDGAVPGGDASDHGAAVADAVAGEAVVPPVPAVDPGEGLVDVLGVTTLSSGPATTIGQLLPVPEPVQHVKGPDSGPDEELGF